MLKLATNKRTALHLTIVIRKALKNYKNNLTDMTFDFDVSILAHATR